MSRPRTSHVVTEAARRERILLAELGADVRAARVRRRWTQARLAGLVELSQATISELERGLAGSMSLSTWERLAVALDRTFVARFSRDIHEEPDDAGHLAMQELVLRLARGLGRRAVELPTQPATSGRSADVCLRDDARAALTLVECWNVIGDVGASWRSFDRKLRDLEAMAATAWPGRPTVVRGCWVVRATRRNRALLARYPEVFATRFTGSSGRWVRSLAAGEWPPEQPGLVWCNVGATGLFAWRRASSPGGDPREREATSHP